MRIVLAVSLIREIRRKKTKFKQCRVLQQHGCTTAHPRSYPHPASHHAAPHRVASRRVHVAVNPTVQRGRMRQLRSTK